MNRGIIAFAEREVEFVDEVFSGAFMGAFRQYVCKLRRLYAAKAEWANSFTPEDTQYYHLAIRSNLPRVVEQIQDREMYVAQQQRFDVEFVVYICLLLACADKGYREHVRKLAFYGILGRQLYYNLCQQKENLIIKELYGCDGPFTYPNCLAALEVAESRMNFCPFRKTLITRSQQEEIDCTASRLSASFGSPNLQVLRCFRHHWSRAARSACCICFPDGSRRDTSVEPVLPAPRTASGYWLRSRP